MGRKARFSLVLFGLLAMTAFTAVVHGQDQVLDADTHNFEFALYMPAKIIMSFQYTDNVSVTNVRSIGQSLWTELSSPNGIEFDTKALDTYDFDVELRYNTLSNQTIQIGVWGGDLPPHNLYEPVFGAFIKFHFKLILSVQPQIPTAQETADAVVLGMKQDLQYYTDSIAILTQQFENNIMTMWVVVTASAVASLSSSIMVVLVIRRHRD